MGDKFLALCAIAFMLLVSSTVAAIGAWVCFDLYLPNSKEVLGVTWFFVAPIIFFIVVSG